MTSEISIAVLADLIEYNSATGNLRWLERSVTYFNGPRALWSCKKWNTRYAGADAMMAVRNTGYRHGRIFNVCYQAHRVAWALHYGRWPSGEIDHINGNRTDNRISNLRDIPKTENQRNMKRNARNKSGATGVFLLPSGKWKASIQGEHIGNFDCLDAAIKARRQAERERGFHPNHGRVA